MSMTDPIADLLTRIRNGSAARHHTIDVPESKLKREIVKVLLRERFIARYVRIRDGKQGLIRIYLRYMDDGKGVIDGLQRVSRPGKRVYFGTDEIPRVLNGLGTMILTTPAGIITDRQAHKLRVGGEPLCIVW